MWEMYHMYKQCHGRSVPHIKYIGIEIGRGLEKENKKDGDHRESMTCGTYITSTRNVMFVHEDKDKYDRNIIYTKGRGKLACGECITY